MHGLNRYLESDEGQVVIFDATNSTEERRQKLVRTVESIHISDVE
jgi:predicted kinase